MLSDDEFRILLDHMDRPWAGFRKVRKGVKKRLRRHMSELGCTTVYDYLEWIDRLPAARNHCEHLLAVVISRFFRDRGMWVRLASHWLPILMDRFPEGLTVWSAGCAGGEEPYSLAMAWEAAAASAGRRPALRIVASDAEPSNLARARQGRYPPGSLKELPQACKQRWFEAIRGSRLLKINGCLGERIRWQTHHLLQAPPGNLFHLVLLRNSLLTYYQGPRLHCAFRRIVDRIAPGGLLVVGSHEKPPEEDFPLARDPQCPWIYQVDTARGTLDG